MRSKIFALALLASTATLVVSASAQQSPPANPPAPAATVAADQPRAHSGQWRASKLIGLDIYNDQNEKVGDVSEILLDQSGKVSGIVIGVGGFLGMGERNVMVEMSKLKFVNEPAKSASTSSTQSTTGTGNTPQRPARSTSEKWYPDHAILNGVTKESLKQMPEFKYD
jgi:sporulation protein YlmC with PRC-barrel domain